MPKRALSPMCEGLTQLKWLFWETLLHGLTDVLKINREREEASGAQTCKKNAAAAAGCCSTQSCDPPLRLPGRTGGNLQARRAERGVIRPAAQPSFRDVSMMHLNPACSQSAWNNRMLELILGPT